MFWWWKCTCLICVSACKEELINLQSFQGNLSIRKTGVVHRQAALVVSRWGSWLSFPSTVMPCQSSWDKDPSPCSLALTCSVKDPHQDRFLLHCQNWLFEICLPQALDGDFQIKALQASKCPALTAYCPFLSRGINRCPWTNSNCGTERRVETWSEDILAIQATCFFYAQQLVRAVEQLRGGTGGAVCTVKVQVTVGGERETASLETLFGLNWIIVL